MNQRTSRDTSDPSKHPPAEPDADGDETKEAPIGDPRPEREVPEKFPGRRERETGKTGGKA